MNSNKAILALSLLLLRELVLWPECKSRAQQIGPKLTSSLLKCGAILKSGVIAMRRRIDWSRKLKV